MGEAKRESLVKPQFVSMAELSCNPLLAFIFDEVAGSKDNLMDALKLGAPSPSYSKCNGKHHPMCSATYGCIGERRLLLPAKFATWIAEAEARLGLVFSVDDGMLRVDKRSVGAR